jgi:hypothetical protein
MTYPEPEVANMNRHPNVTVRSLSSGGDKVAVSFMRHCWIAKIIVNTPEITKRVIILPSCHAYSVPPHCRANVKLTINGVKMIMAGRSSCFIFSAVGRFACAAVLETSTNTKVLINMMTTKGMMM